jgi:hypothetical protein
MKWKFWKEKEPDSEDKTRITQEEWLRIKYARAEKELTEYVKDKKEKIKKGKVIPLE